MTAMYTSLMVLQLALTKWILERAHILSHLTAQFCLTPPNYSMVLADDINGNGKTDLLVVTRNGNVFALSTETPFHPLKSW